MLTESTQTYQDQLNEQQAKDLLWLWELVKTYPVIAGLAVIAVVCVVVCVVLKFIIPWIVQYCQKHGIKSGSEVAPSEHLNEEIRRNEVRKKRISILPAPAVDPKFCDWTLHESLIELAQKIELLKV